MIKKLKYLRMFMPKIKINHHVGVSIIRFRYTNKFLFGIYDETYPKKRYRGKANLIGGNHSIVDSSPWELFIREIKEEFNNNYENKKKIKKLTSELVGKGFGQEESKKEFAKEGDIKEIRDSILLNTKPYSDFVVSLPTDKGRISILYSVFETILSKETLKKIKKNISSGKKIRKEGLTKIIDLKDIKTGKILSVAGTPEIMEEYTKNKIPRMEKIISKKMGKPRKLFKEYLTDFEYHFPVKN